MTSGCSWSWSVWNWIGGCGCACEDARAGEVRLQRQMANVRREEMKKEKGRLFLLFMVNVWFPRIALLSYMLCSSIDSSFLRHPLDPLR